MSDTIQTGALVAVYGSLRLGLGNHRVIENGIREDDGVISGVFRMVSLGGFPALLKTTEPTDIVVEVYAMPNDGGAQAQSLDWLEGYPHHYNREVVELIDGRKCWVYFQESGHNDSQPSVDSGDWKLYTANRGMYDYY